jgi:hypothetical protein
VATGELAAITNPNKNVIPSGARDPCSRDKGRVLRFAQDDKLKCAGTLAGSPS